MKVIVQHTVSDYSIWRPVFIAHGEKRRLHGATGHTILRAADNPNNVIIINNFATAEGAHAFAADPSLKDVMMSAGVTSAPQIWFCEETEHVRY